MIDVNPFQSSKPTSPKDVRVHLTGPNVIVKPSNQVENDLELAFNNQNMETVNSLFNEHYSGNVNCSMMRKLVDLITSCKLYKNNEENPLSTVDIFFEFVSAYFRLYQFLHRARCDFLVYHFLFFLS